MDAATRALRARAREYASLTMSDATTGIFLADTLCALSGHAREDCELLAQVLARDGQHRRALTALRRVRDGEMTTAMRALAGECLLAMRDYEGCLEALGGGETPPERGARGAEEAALSLLRGRAYEAMESRTRAVRWYKHALTCDAMCFGAYEAMLATHMLTEAEERELVESLELDDSNAWVREMYAVMGNSRQVTSELATVVRVGVNDDEFEAGTPPRGGAADASASSASSVIEALRLSGDVRIACARRMYQHGEFAACYVELRRQFELEPARLTGFPLYLSTLVELGKKNDLYLLAHSLVAEYPDKAVTWFAIGCYYMTTRQYDSARKYFSKATSIDASFVQAWIGFGHAFAAQDESDQAMAAYRTATRLFTGSHVPVMSIGMEYQRTNNSSLAFQFFLKAFEICDTDPLLHNEYGVLLYRQGDYENAVLSFQQALDLAPRPMSSRWESLIVNMAQALRKLGRYDEAIATFEEALSVAPKVASTYASLAFTYHIKSRCTEPVALGLAIEYYHKALALRSSDTFSQTHLELALIDQSAISIPKHNAVEWNTTFDAFGGGNTTLDAFGGGVAQPESPETGGLFPSLSPRSFQSTPTFGQTPFSAARGGFDTNESVDMDESVDMEQTP